MNVEAGQQMHGLVAQILAARLAAGGTCVLRVRTGSMAPLLAPGDSVQVAPLSGAPPQLGALLVVRRGDYWVTHRLIGRMGAGQQLLLKGDACPLPDVPVASTAVLGIVVARCRGGQWAPLTGSNSKNRLRTLALRYGWRARLRRWLISLVGTGGYDGA